MPLEVKPSTDLSEPKDVDDFLKDVREWRQNDLDADANNRSRGIDDTRYTAGYQWPLEDFQWRVANNVPAMTFNMVPSLIQYRLGARSRRRIGPRILPISAGKQYESIAFIREGLIRNIERTSDIPTVDGIISQNQLVAGVANYEIAIEYANADSFDTDIMIRTDLSPWSVIWDGMSTDPTGKDARRVMKETVISRKDYEALYPDEEIASVGENPANSTIWPIAATAGPGGLYTDWFNQDTVRIATVWTMHTKYKTLALFTNGETLDITGQEPGGIGIPDGSGGFHTVVIDPDTQKPIVRKSPCKYARGVVTNGVKLLSKPYEIDIDRVPIVKVSGWAIMNGERLERYGLINFAKDALSFYNYVKSDRIERIVYRNRANYEAQEDALSVEQEAAYKNSHRLRGGVLKYRGPKPEQVEAPIVDQAAIIETQAAQQSIYDILGMKPGLVGLEGSTPHSGIALEQEQNISDNGGAVYDDNLLAAKREVYRLCNQIIPYVYDGPRIAKIIGEDGKAKEAILNDPENPESEDITIGKYAVDASTGPSQDTQRTQAIAFYETMFNSNPELMGLVAPELIELLNIPGTDKLVKALRERSGVVDQEDPEAVAAAQAQAEEAQKVKEMQFAEQQAKTDALVAKAESSRADAESKAATAQAEVAQANERASNARESEMKAMREAQLTQAKMAEMDKRSELMAVQMQKIFAEIQKIQAETTKVKETPVTEAKD